MTYIPTIGLEIHAELKTRTKMFCGCLNDPEEQHPNANVCPICLAHPGTLPVPNKQAIEAVLLTGMALNGDIPATSKFDRKNYFYPDLPKGYQISQYDQPLIMGGILNGVRILRIHLEEDTGRLQHIAYSKEQMANEKLSVAGHKPSVISHLPSASLVDFNRAGVPLMELVTEPDVKSAEQAVQFAKELQLIFRYLGVSDADMEKGQMRVEANVSVRPNGKRIEANKSEFVRNSSTFGGDSSDQTLGTKVEIKNLNSFEAVRGAIEYEFTRQAELLEKGEKVVHETRGWDDMKKKTVSQRTKEEAHDYRYFPEPDIPPLDLSTFDLGAIKLKLPELPQAKRVRFEKEFNLRPEQAEILIQDREAANFFEEAVSEFEEEDEETTKQEIQLLMNYLTTDLRALMTEQEIGWRELKITPENFADLIYLISHGKLSSRAAKDILGKMMESGGDPHEIMKMGKLEQSSDTEELDAIVSLVIQENPQAVADYKKGKQNALQFLVGQAMKALKGRGNPQMLQELFRKALGRDSS